MGMRWLRPGSAGAFCVAGLGAASATWAQQEPAAGAGSGAMPGWFVAIATLTVALVLGAACVRYRGHKDRLEAVLQSAMDAIITVDARQRVVLFNEAAQTMFGCTGAQAIGAPLDRFIPQRFRAAHYAHIEQFAKTGKSLRRMGRSSAPPSTLPSTLWALRADGREFPIEASISHSKVGGKDLLTVILRDISERLLASQELNLARRGSLDIDLRLEAIVLSAMDAIIAVDAGQRVVLFNGAAEKMFGCSAAEARAGTLERFIPQRLRAGHQEHVERFAATGETSRRMGVRSQLLALRSDGSEFPIEASISQALVGGQKLLTVILHDITQRNRAEEEIRRTNDELRGLSLAMLEMREAERTRMARELHDELGQLLTALKMDVEELGTKIPRERTDLAQYAASMSRLLDTTVATTRRISSDLRPLVLDDLGLVAAAEWLLEGLAQRTGITFGLDLDPACVELGEPYASTLFRIIQESLTNVARHAHATHVTVRLRCEGRFAVLTIADNGVGMPANARAKPGSFGLRGLRERVLLLRGTLSILGGANAGTTLSVHLPIPEIVNPQPV